MPVPTLSVFLEIAARATIVLASAGLAAAALHRSSASARHFVWALGLAGALLVPACSLMRPRWTVPIVTIAAPAVTTDVHARPIERSGGRGEVPDRVLPPDGASRAKAGESGRKGTDWSWAIRIWRVPVSSTGAIVLLIWALGAAAILGRTLLGILVVRWMTRRARKVAGGTWLPLARTLAADLGLARVRFVRSGTASMPMAWGVFRASVLMPADADEWPPHRLRVVLLHELAHVKRRDCLTHLVAQIVCAAYWFNPLAWIAARRLRQERERACDDLVLQAGTRGSDYADELLDIARVMQRRRFPAVLGGAGLAMAHRSQLEGRLIAILDPGVPRRAVTRAPAAAGAAVFALLIVSVASVRPWAEEPAAVHAAVSDARQSADKPAESWPAPRAADVRGGARVADPHQAMVQDRVEPADQHRAGTDVHTTVDAIVADAVGSMTSGIVQGVIGGVVGGVTGGIAGGIDADISMALAQAVPTPNPNPGPRPDGARKTAADPRAVAALADALRDTDKDVREMALHALVQLRDPRIFDPLVAALKDGSPDIREQAAFGLGQLGDARAVEPLVSSLKDENGDVREQAAFALGQLRDPRAVEALVVALKDATAAVREQVAFALGQLHDPRAVEGLTAALKDANVDVRRQAAFALGQIRY